MIKIVQDSDIFIDDGLTGHFNHACLAARQAEKSFIFSNGVMYNLDDGGSIPIMYKGNAFINDQDWAQGYEYRGDNPDFTFE